MFDTTIDRVRLFELPPSHYNRLVTKPFIRQTVTGGRLTFAYREMSACARILHLSMSVYADRCSSSEFDRMYFDELHDRNEFALLLRARESDVDVGEALAMLDSALAMEFGRRSSGVSMSMQSEI
jgi:hypothetical protein